MRSRGKTASDGRRVSAQDSMSRTKKSGSTAQRSTSVSNHPGSAREPAAKAAFSRIEEFDALKASARRASRWGASRDRGRCDGADDAGGCRGDSDCEDDPDCEDDSDCGDDPECGDGWDCGNALVVFIKVPPHPKERPCHSVRVKLGQGVKQRKRSDSAGDSTSGRRPGPRAVPSTSGPRTRHRRDVPGAEDRSSRVRTRSDGLSPKPRQPSAKPRVKTATGRQASERRAKTTTEREAAGRLHRRVRPPSRRPPCGRIRRRPLDPRCTSGGSL